MTQHVEVDLIASSETFKELLRGLTQNSGIRFYSDFVDPLAIVLLDFPTTWSFSHLESMNSIDRARTVVVTQGSQSAYTDLVASYHVSGVVPVTDHAYLISSIYAAAGSMRTYSWQSGLTYMELRVSRLLLRGCDTNTIASQLRVTTKTVNAHISNAISKLGFDSRAQYIAALLSQHPA